MKEKKVLKVIIESIDKLKGMYSKGVIYSNGAMGIIEAAFSREFGKEMAKDFSFELTDWVYEISVMMAMNLEPKKFTTKEVNKFFNEYLCHISNHILSAQMIQYKAMGLSKEEAYKMLAPVVESVYKED